MRRTAALAAFVALLVTPLAEAKPKPHWAAAQIETVVAAGFLAPSAAEFRPDDALTRGELAGVLTTLTGTEQALAEPERAVTVRELDAQLVKALGLVEEARAIRAAVGAAGLTPPGRLGTESVARLLGLRLNHPQQADALELLPNDPVSRAETAFSLARYFDLSDWDVQRIEELSASFVLPELTDWQRRVLTRAVRFVGFPYVWGGSSERTQAPFGQETPGGFDCSGFVWRVYKLEPFAEAPSLAEMLRGRTTYQMSGEVAKAARVPAEALQPGDVLFFGDRGPRSKPTQVGHVALYLGGGWFVHSSRYGTTLHPLDGWYADTFAWARRPLAEAGLF